MKKTTEFEIFLTALNYFVKIFNDSHDTDYSVEPYAGTDHIAVAFPTKKERWAAKMAGKARKAANRGELIFDFQDRVTTVYSIYMRKTGTAIRSLCDKDDTDLGIAIAYCRVIGEPIPDFVFE